MNKWITPNQWEVSSADSKPKYTLTIKSNVSVEISSDSSVNKWGLVNEWGGSEIYQLPTSSKTIHYDTIPDLININPNINITQG